MKPSDQPGSAAPSIGDVVTGLPGRLQFLDHLNCTLQAEVRRPLAVGLINIDRFRLVNDGLGPDAGDALLRQFAERFRGALPAQHTIARLGGDQFGLILGEVSSDTEIAPLIAACRKPFDQPIEVGGHELHVSFRVGAVVADADHRAAGDLLHHANRALRQAKQRPEERLAVAERPARGAALARLQLENDIHRGLSRDEFLPVFHPIVSMVSGRTVGFEALARWNQPGRGMVPPGAFIGVAEETGMVAAIDDRILALACREAARWPADIFVTVNVSGYRFGDPSIIDGVKTCLAESGLDPQRLKLEITESTIMTDASATARLVKAIAAHGVGVAIDDFGTGYSSLAYLHRFDATTLKIDRSFVQAMVESDQGLEIVRMIIMLARTLDMAVVAEGIETQSQFDALRALGCEYGQGYLFAKPLSAEDARRRLIDDAGPIREAI